MPGRLAKVTNNALDIAGLDPAVPPTQDLYRHVNGAWLAKTEIPSDKPLWGAFMKLHEEAQEAVREIITSLTPEPGAATETNQIANFYAAFMDEAHAEELGSLPLVEPLAHVDSVRDVAGLGRLFGWLLRNGHRTLISFDSDADPGNPQRYLGFVGQSGLGLPDEEYYRLEQHAEIRKAYLAHIERLFTLAGIGDAAEQAQAVMALETDIAATHWDKVRLRDMVQMYNPMSFDEIADSAPGLPLKEYLEGAQIAPEKVETVVNAQPSFFTDVARLVTEARLEAWKSWARWRVISSMSMLLSKAFVDERFAFVGTTLAGIPEIEPRWQRGVALAQTFLGEPIGKLYVEKHFSTTAKKRMDMLVANLLEAYRRSITDLDWMTEETKVAALDKLSKFRPKIGYPEKWRDFSGLEIEPDDLTGNIARACAFDLDFQLNRIGTDMDPHEWLMPPQMVNAYYHPLRNEIVFPAAILQPPFFNEEADDAVNYGGIGAVIGHEIGHGFDDQGSTCDGDGVLRNWWTDADKEAFEARTKKLVAQYDALTPEGLPADLHVNGDMTLGENIGDLGGLSIAYQAWKIACGDCEPEPIDGLTGTQRLFLSWATVWQQKIRPEAAAQRLATDPHSPNEFRANQTAMNVPAFHEAFGTKEGDAMWLAPEDRVKIW